MLTTGLVAEVRARVRQWRAEGLRVSFVPTMGNLHAGHMSLLAAARYRAERVIASIFVNPLQFGPSEDYAQYPRTPVEDERLLHEAHCDLLFAPPVEQIYPKGGDQATRVQVRGLSEILDGQIRPGHFDGVATVVAKLFHIVAPDVAVFGEKDYQQLLVIRRMTLGSGHADRDHRCPHGARRRWAGAELAQSLSQRRGARARAGDPSGAARRQCTRSMPAIATSRPSSAPAAAALESGRHAGGLLLDAQRRGSLASRRASTTELVVLAAARIGRSRLIDNLRAYRSVASARR